MGKIAKTQCRQGDVLLRRIADAPESQEKFRPRKQVVAATGETTGHSHIISGAMVFAGPSGRVFLPDGGKITHEEHAEIDLSPGVWEIIRQREFIEVAGRSIQRNVRD